MSRNHLESICREAYQKFLGYNKDSIQEVAEAILADEDLLRECALTSAINGLRGEQRRHRGEIGKQLLNQEEGKKESRYDPSFRDRVVLRCSGLLHWPLTDGTILEKASREKLMQDANQYLHNSQGNLRNWRFEVLVANKLKEGQLVGEVLSEKQLQTLFKQADREIKNKLLDFS